MYIAFKKLLKICYFFSLKYQLKKNQQNKSDQAEKIFENAIHKIINKHVSIKTKIIMTKIGQKMNDLHGVDWFFFLNDTTSIQNLISNLSIFHQNVYC